jgi:Rieske Fe-S protein
MMQLGQKSAKYLIISIVFITTFSSCDDINDSQIPDVPFSFNINLIISNELTVAGNSLYFPRIGYGGVIVVCNSTDDYYAYDAACTHEISQTCKVKNEGFVGTCECCDSQFLLIYEAYPSTGPAVAPLRQYQISKLNSTTLRVYN